MCVCVIDFRKGVFFHDCGGGNERLSVFVFHDCGRGKEGLSVFVFHDCGGGNEVLSVFDFHECGGRNEGLSVFVLITLARSFQSCSQYGKN